MDSVSYLRPATVIREQFVPSPQVQRALSKFVDGEEPSTFRVYSTGRRVVDLVEYHRSSYDLEIRAIQERVQALGRRAFFLTGRTRLMPRPDGSGRLLMEPHEQDRLDELVALLRGVPSLEKMPVSPHYLYVDFARNSLVKNLQLRQDAIENFQARGRHPGMRQVFSVSSPEIVAQDVPHYRLRAEDVAPDIE